MSPRTIHLRRPATIYVQEGVFVPQGGPGILDEVDHRWNALCAANPTYFDGRLCHVLGVHRNGHGGAVLHVIDCAYRFLAVQNDQFDLGVRALGVKGVTVLDDHCLMGKRANFLAAYKDLWEFAPAGGVEPGKQPLQTIQDELCEETGLTARQEPTSIAVLFDPVLKCWELVFRIVPIDDRIAPHTREYSQLEWRRASDLPSPLSPIARQIAELIDNS
jgi:8-oxo-dGTP pyrophosphatase MutT (NUDIX family)